MAIVPPSRWIVVASDWDDYKQVEMLRFHQHLCPEPGQRCMLHAKRRRAHAIRTVV